MKKCFTVLFFILISAYIFAATNEKDYKNISINDGLFYTGKVSIYPGKKQYHNIWEIKSNSVTGFKQQVIIKCISETKAYTNYTSTEEDDYTQYLINENCEFLATGKINNQWVYIKVSNEDFRWISTEKISFSNGSINDLPELKFQKYYTDMFTELTFYNGYIHIRAFDGFTGFPKDSTVNDFFPFKEISNNKLKYIIFNNKTYLKLSNENLIYLIDENNKLICYAISEINPNRMEVFGYSLPAVFSASSELKEKDITYFARNLDICDSVKPWVESAQGDGIGEYVKIDYEGINGLIISNGYVDYNKPNLYENNNRVKVFEVYNQDNRKIQEIELTDSPDPQVFKIKEKCSSIKLVIKEVYKGSKWNDTCVNFIKIIPEFCSMDGFIYK